MASPRTNIEIVQAALAEFQKGNPAGYMEIVDDNVKASMWSGLIHDEPIMNKNDFQKAMDKISDKCQISRFEPRDWAEVNDVVYFTVGLEAKLKKADGSWSDPVQFEGTVRKVMRNGKIVEKHHMLDMHRIKQLIA